MLAHNVYFTLEDASEAAIERQIGLCREHLDGHEGTVLFGALPLAAGLDRPVNDQDFHVHLMVVFESRAHHDAYQVHPRHQAFIEASQGNWKAVRVFDSQS